jgi:hypothetical protein
MGLPMPSLGATGRNGNDLLARKYRIYKKCTMHYFKKYCGTNFLAFGPNRAASLGKDAGLKC